MATDPQKDAKMVLNMMMRQQLGDAYSFVRGYEYSKMSASVTYEQLLDAAIGRIEGTPGSGDLRPTRMARVMRIRDDIEATVNTVKELPPTAWTIEKYDPSTDAPANPPEDEPEEDVTV